MKTLIEPTYTIDIYMAGDIAQAKQIIRKYCERGFCVHIHPADYIYTGGEEVGFKVGIVNYPRFPASSSELLAAAKELAGLLIEGLYQHSALIISPANTIWITRRKTDNEIEGQS